ncbi:MAG: transglutaminase family protein, partial [Planctomycetes bacterium]|nr:transglutaminase family protein [Planctomycetota bacterium]
MRYRVRHLTEYTYSDSVTLSQNVAHLAPRDGAGQRVLEHRLEIEPAPDQRWRRLDYFGNDEDSFVVLTAHRRLTVLSNAEVDVARRPPSSADIAATPPWEELARSARRDAMVAEYIYDSRLIPCCRELADYARPDFAAGSPVLAAGLAFAVRIRREFAYDPGSTNATTPILDALELRRGVCQDFAQVMIGSLRSLGLPARYVSGYLETDPPPGRPRLVGADASHAWVQLWCGPALGWVDIDPTNACLPGERHIVVAIGRDFADVSPLKGLVLGGGQAKVRVAVDV